MDNLSRILINKWISKKYVYIFICKNNFFWLCIIYVNDSYIWSIYENWTVVYSNIMNRNTQIPQWIIDVKLLPWSNTLTLNQQFEQKSVVWMKIDELLSLPRNKVLVTKGFENKTKRMILRWKNMSIVKSFLYFFHHVLDIFHMQLGPLLPGLFDISLNWNITCQTFFRNMKSILNKMFP